MMIVIFHFKSLDLLNEFSPRKSTPFLPELSLCSKSKANCLSVSAEKYFVGFSTAKLKLVFPNKQKMKEVLKSFLILLLLQSTYNKVNGLGTNWKKESSLLLPIDYYHYYDDDYLQFEPSHSLPVVSNNNYTKVSIQHTFVT